MIANLKEMEEMTELMDVTFLLKEIIDLLKGKLLSDTPPADVVLKKRHMEYFA
ncbi:hypothetical protein CASFOL_003092 [Castilleja foliolosa]|uniref:Uncharacterized protein n=1 Tax=Castilleja foliolosa TaxID=1961234 RepID=A0ABD3EJJ9_9LAMI